MWHSSSQNVQEFRTKMRTCRNAARESRRVAEATKLLVAEGCNDPGDQLLKESYRELGIEIDHVALVVFCGRNVQCSKHCRNSTPYRGVSSIPAWSKSSLAHHMPYNIRITQPTWTYASALAENIFLRVVIRQRATGVNEPLWLKMTRVGVPLFIPCHGPEIMSVWWKLARIYLTICWSSLSLLI